VLLLSFALMQMKVSKEKIKAAHLFLKRIRSAGNKRTRRCGLRFYNMCLRTSFPENLLWSRTTFISFSSAKILFLTENL
jgi:hypothetical protein